MALAPGGVSGQDRAPALVVYFNPLSRGAGWRHATATQIVGHWRKAGRHRGAAAMPAMSSR
jgi:hypothetical protein